MNAPTLEADYRDRRAARALALAAAERRTQQLGNLRLFLAGLTLLLLLWPLWSRSGTPWLGLIPVAVGFLWLGRALDRAFEAQRRATVSVRYYDEALARYSSEWRKLPDHGGAFLPGAPSWALDLDLFGPASLYQLLSRAATVDGRATLAYWLQNPATTSEIEARQQAYRALAPALDLRESLAVAAGSEDGRPMDLEPLLRWAEGRTPLPYPRLLATLGVLLPATFFVTFAYYFWSGNKIPVVIAALVQLTVLYLVRNQVGSRAALLSGPERVLPRAATLLQVVENLELQGSLLASLRDRVKMPGTPAGPASRRLRGLLGLVELLDARLNPFFALTFGPALLWELNLVLRAERWQLASGDQLRGWFRAAGELEALASFAALAAERPDYGDATFLEAEATFESVALRHPLINLDQVRGNDLTLGGKGSVLLLSGSNMSGKSTLLRSVGLATVMAQAGAPVAAARLRMSRLFLASSVRVVDSLAEGTSHFYAELKRLKEITDLAQSAPGPVLYLLDEVLHGTNSRERFIGALAVIRWLSRTGAMGIVTTHDLALAKVADTLPAGLVVNRHFSDAVDGGKIIFDYVLRDGPIGSTNAIRLMRAVGLDLDYREDQAP